MPDSRDLPQLALSVRQPWAWAIIFAGKDIENRIWARGNPAISVRGRVCIHASKKMSRAEYESAREFMASINVACPPPRDLVRGAIIGTIDVVDFVEQSISPWFFGQSGLIVRDPEAITPVSAVGALGFFKWKKSGDVEPPALWMKHWPELHPTIKRDAIEPLKLPI